MCILTDQVKIGVSKVNPYTISKMNFKVIFFKSLPTDFYEELINIQWRAKYGVV